MDGRRAIVNEPPARSRVCLTENAEMPVTRIHSGMPTGRAGCCPALKLDRTGSSKIYKLPRRSASNLHADLQLRRQGQR